MKKKIIMVSDFSKTFGPLTTLVLPLANIRALIPYHASNIGW